MVYNPLTIRTFLLSLEYETVAHRPQKLTRNDGNFPACRRFLQNRQPYPLRRNLHQRTRPNKPESGNRFLLQ